MTQDRKKIIKRALIAIGAIVFVCVVLFGSFVYVVSKGAFMDDGPFTGVTRSECELSNPYSSVKLPDGTFIESFLPTKDGISPTVRHIKANGVVSWCVYANGQDKTSVSSVEFYSAQPYEYNKYIVTGRVHWTFGHESTKWYLSTDGELINYWYSW